MVERWGYCEKEYYEDIRQVVQEDKYYEDIRQVVKDELRFKKAIENWKVFNPVKVDEELVFIERFLVE